MSVGTLIGYGIVSISLAATGAAAVSNIVPYAFADDGAPAPQWRARSQATYLTGGAGTEQVQAMRTLAGNYNLKLAFVAPAGGRPAGYIKIAIQDDRGNTVIDAMSEGPLFYARVPDGLYRVVIESQGQTLIQIVNLHSGRKANMRFYWPATHLAPVRGVRG